MGAFPFNNGENFLGPLGEITFFECAPRLTYANWVPHTKRRFFIRNRIGIESKPDLGFVPSRDIQRSHTDASMWGAVIDLHHRLQHLHVTEGVVSSEVAPQFGFQSAVETLHDAGFDVFIFRRKEMDLVFFQPSLKFTIGKFRSFVGLQSLGERWWDRFESIYQCAPRLVLERNHPCLFGKHIDTSQQKFESAIVSTQSGHIDEIGLPLLVGTCHDDSSSWKLVSYRFMKGVSILSGQPLFYPFRTQFGFLGQRLNTSITADPSDVVIWCRQPFLLLPHDALNLRSGSGTIYVNGFHFNSFLTLKGSSFLFLPLTGSFFTVFRNFRRTDGVLLISGVRYLSRLRGVISPSVECDSDMGDSRCIQSHRRWFPTKSRGTLLWWRARANCRQPCGWSTVFRFRKTSFTKSTRLLPLMTSPS